MNDNLFVIEQDWLALFQRVPYKYQSAIVDQINLAERRREYSEYYYFLYFHVPEEIQPIIPYSDFELEAIVSHSVSTQDVKQEIYDTFDQIPVLFSNSGRAPTHFILHIRNGYVALLEIFNLDSSKIDLNGLAEGEIKYRIPKPFWCTPNGDGSWKSGPGDGSPSQM